MIQYPCLGGFCINRTAICKSLFLLAQGGAFLSVNLNIVLPRKSINPYSYIYHQGTQSDILKKLCFRLEFEFVIFLHQIEYGK